MITHTMQLITIITESVLEHSLIEDLERLGVGGYTITNARGKGHRGLRDAAWSTDSNIRVEVLCEAQVADTIAEHLTKTYYVDYAMMLYLSDVKVLRPEKFACNCDDDCDGKP